MAETCYLENVTASLRRHLFSSAHCQNPVAGLVDMAAVIGKREKVLQLTGAVQPESPSSSGWSLGSDSMELGSNARPGD